jgi:hydrogenase 3 maturation protease
MLRDELTSKLSGRVAIVCVGDAAHGDDGAGPLFVDLLERFGVENVIDGGSSPELETWRVRHIAPNTVLFVDAVDLGVEPGDAALLAAADLRATGYDTHRAPLRLTMQYLEMELDCRCYLLAVQPSVVSSGAVMSDAVRSSVEVLARMLCEGLRARN